MLSAHSFKTYWEQLMGVISKHLHQAYFNRKEFYSVVLLTFCDATVAFYYVWTGNPGGTHDSIMLQHSDLFVHSNERIPPGYCLLGYSGFPLLEWHVTAFNDHGNLKRQQKLFNKTHSRCHYWKAFGVLKNRFRRLYRFEILDLTLIVNKFRAVYVHLWNWWWSTSWTQATKRSIKLW